MRSMLKITNTTLLAGIFFLAYQLGTDRAASRVPIRDGGPSAEFIRGDANDDGKLDVSDAVFSLDFLFLGGDVPPCRAAADANDDGVVDITDAIYELSYLFLGDAPPPLPFPGPGPDPTEDLGCRVPPLPPLPEVGSEGGPDRPLSGEEALSWRRGRAFFDQAIGIEDGLGPLFNGDSCRGCHLDPVVGGAGGLDVDVVRFAHVDAEGFVSDMEGGPAASRHGTLTLAREEVPAGANVIETRQTPTILGLGLVDRIPDSVLEANADPQDLDGDGISGRLRRIGEQIGRFGHKNGVPSLIDFTADALLNEIGLTVDPALSSFAGGTDTDDAADPEVSDAAFFDLAFFVSHLAPPVRRLPDDPLDRQRVEDGEQVFLEIGCAKCHIPELEGEGGEPVRAFSDFLLHDVADPSRHHVGEPGVEPREFRTAPLWGLRDTSPYLHDGSAESPRDAILRGHHGEALTSREAFRARSLDDRIKLEQFLESL